MFGMIATGDDGPTSSYDEYVLNALAGLEGKAVQFHTGTRKIELHASGIPIGVYEGKLQSSNTACSVRNLNTAGTFVGMQGAAVAIGAKVKVVSGKFVTATSGSEAVAVKVGNGQGAGTGSGADLDLSTFLPVGGNSYFVATASTAKTNVGSAAILALAVGGTYSQAEVQALRAQIAALSVDVEAIRANLVTAGPFSA